MRRTVAADILRHSLSARFPHWQGGAIYGFGAARFRYILRSLIRIAMIHPMRDPSGTSPGRQCLSVAGKTNLYGLLALIAVAAIPSLALAQTQGQGAAPALSLRSRSFITPFPQGERYHVHVIGDGLAEGLFSGLQSAFEKDGTMRVINSWRANTSLTRPDRSNWAAEIDEMIKAQPMHIAVIMVGLNDTRDMRSPESGRWMKFGTDEWRDIYMKEVDKLTKTLKERHVAVYWVGMPVMASQTTNDKMATLNDIIRERAYLANAKFVDVWNGFTDQTGKFSAYGPDLTGQTQRLREADGISFTARGNRKLANYVEVILRRDLNEAKAERNIPLAGDEEEQSRLIPKAPGAEIKDTEAGVKASWMPELKVNDDKPASKDAPTTSPTPALQSSVRPSGGPLGETIPGDMNEGVTSLATVSPIADLNAAIDAGERRLPVSERQYYKVLVKGEPLKPKPGRADDFKWPRG